MGHVIVGVPPGATASAPLRWAHRAAVGSGATLDVVSVIETVAVCTGYEMLALAPPSPPPGEQQWRVIADELEDHLFEVPLVQHVESGRASDVLLHYGAHAELLVIGAPTHRRWPWDGATARRCARGACCPLVIVTGDGRYPELVGRPDATGRTHPSAPGRIVHHSDPAAHTRCRRRHTSRDG